MQMYEAAEKVLRELGTPTHIRDLWKYIEKREYFHFGAKDPASALDTCLARHGKGIAITKHAGIKVFYRAAPAIYGLLDWLDEVTKRDLDFEDNIAQEQIKAQLDCSLFLEEDWQKWIFKNVRENGLEALGFGPLSFHDKEYQETHYGHYNTDSVGEMDFLLRTKAGDFLVLELKRQGDDETVGQICRYVGWVKRALAEKGESVYGVILAAHISERLRCAIEAVGDNICFQQLILNVEFGERSAHINSS